MNARSITLPSTGKPANKGTTLQYSAISKAFGGHPVLQNLDLQIAKGEFIAIVGRSGCGKTTLLRLTAGLESADKGVVTAQTGCTARQPDIRIMFQDARLLPWKTVIDNIGLGLHGQWREAAADALTSVGLADKADAWPATLSGGQRQRVALARALVHQPDLLLLDEPLGALDALTRIEMQQLVEKLWQAKGFTAILVTHDVPEALALADRVLLVENGRIGLDLRVDLPRPRQRGSAMMAALEATVLRRVLQQPAANNPRDIGFTATGSRLPGNFTELQWAW